jgi:membrane-associated phospholipid phosphatase
MYRRRVSAPLGGGVALLSPPARPAALVACAVMALMVLGLALRYRDDPTAGHLDTLVASAIQSEVPPDVRLLDLVVRLGDPLPMAVLTGALALAAWLMARTRAVLLALLGPTVASATTELLKPAIGRTYHGVLAFPSGHTTGMTALAAVVAILVVSSIRTRPLLASLLAIAGVALAGLLMAFALLAQHLHYPTDTLGGFLTALVVIIAEALCIDAICTRITATRH